MSISSIGSLFSKISSSVSSVSSSPFSTTASTAVSKVGDGISVSSFSSNYVSESQSSNLNELYSRKSQVQGEINEFKGQADQNQADINARQREIIESRDAGQAKDANRQELEKKYSDLQADYDKDSQTKNQAASELTSLQQQSSAKDQEINSNAQQISKVSSDISSARSEPSSLKKPTPPSSDDENGQSNYQSQLPNMKPKEVRYKAKLTVTKPRNRNWRPRISSSRPKSSN